MERFEEFAKDVIRKFPKEAEGILREHDFLGEFNRNGDIPDGAVEIVSDYLSDNLNDVSHEVPGYEIVHKGGDSSIYEGGIWTTELRECYGWYYWIEPEGQKYGLYSSLDEALSESGGL